MLNYEKYAFVDNVTVFNAATFNAILRDLDARLGKVEADQPALETAIAQLVQVGLDRINLALLPAFSTITSIQKMGFLSAPIAAGTDLLLVPSASTSIVIAPTQKDVFIPPPWVVLARTANATDYAIAKVLAYVPAVGGLTLQVTSVHGNPGDLHSSAAITIDVGAGLIHWPAHGRTAGQAITLTTTGALPTGLLPGVVYYVATLGLGTDVFALSTTYNGVPIVTSGTQSGVHTGFAWDHITDVTVIGCPGGALAAIDSMVAVLAAKAAIDTAYATIQANLAEIQADTTYVHGVVLAGPVANIDGQTGAILNVERTTRKGAASGYAGLDSAGHVPPAQLPIGLASGVLGLDGSGKALTTQLPDAVLGCNQFLGSWNAATNSPQLTSGIGVKGATYKVSQAGTTNLDGNSAWGLGDYAIFNGNTWDRRNAPLPFTPIQQGTGIDQAPSVPIKIGWSLLSSLLKASYNDGTTDIDLGSLWSDLCIGANPAPFRQTLGAEPAKTANGVVTKTASATLLLSDAGQIVEMNVATANVLTIPPNAAVAFPLNTRIDVVQTGLGQTSFTPGVGVTILSAGNNLKLSAQYAGASLYQRALNTWVLMGSLTS